MDVPEEFFELVKKKLEDAGYDHAIHVDRDGQIKLDMQGIALIKQD